MSRLSWNEIQDRAVEFAHKYQNETYENGESQSFWSDFLNVFGIDRKRYGAFFEYAIKKNGGSQGFIDMFWPGKILAEQKSAGKDLSKANTQAFDYLHNMPDHDLPQVIVVSDFATFQVIDPETREITEFTLQNFDKHVQLFGFLIDQKSTKLAEENPVNRQAAEAMASLHNTLRDTGYTGHDLELLLVRLVFCLFADDSGIFEHRSFEAYFYNRTEIDGSDFGPRLNKLFEVLNTPDAQRFTMLDADLVAFPYINGGLFAATIKTPDFNYAMRDALLKAMELDWSQVSPAIFGSMFQGVMDEKQRRNLGAHYTSEANILKVIKPLFLDNLYDEFAKVKKRKSELAKFHDKLRNLTFLDPACGCGNKLVITYRELRRLEHKVVKALAKDKLTIDAFATAGEGASSVKVNVDQMYGIEIEEFPALVAQTALWLTDHQMNTEYSKLSGRTFKRIPLVTSPTIVNDNALTYDWNDVISAQRLSYIISNPPYNGSKTMTPAMRKDLEAQFDGHKNVGVLDFVSAWYAKSTKMMQQNPNIEAALVSTSSITQGEQVGILWSYLLKQGVHINFAHRTFKWQNDAKGVAGVHCVIIGFALHDKTPKFIYDYPDVQGEPVTMVAKKISPYLFDGDTMLLNNRAKQISNAPKINYGSFALDNGQFTLSMQDAELIIKSDLRAEKYIRPFMGGYELINGVKRYCLWLRDASPSEIRNIDRIRERVESVRQWRSSSLRKNTLELASTPTLFAEVRQPTKKYIAFPTLSSENRNYIPIAFLNKDVIASNQLYIINSEELYTFGVLTSKMHMAWVAAVCGRLESRYRYSSRLVYNNFIWPEATEEQKSEIEKLAQAILDARAEYPDATLADLYDPLTMPPDLVKAHKVLDKAIDRLYCKESFANDAERVAHLFVLYKVVAKI